MLNLMAIIQENFLTSRANIDQVTDEMIFEIGKGNKDAFKEFYYCTQHALYGYILSYLKNRHETEDILHDTYIKIREKAHTYTGYEKPMAWVFTVAKNLSLMKLRNAQQISDISEFENTASQSKFEENVIDNIVLKTALDILDQQSKEIIILHSVTGLKFREIASDLNLNIATVLTKYNRALKKMQTYLKEKE